MASAAKLAGFDLLRQRLSVYFGEDDQPAWYEGTVDDYDHDKTSSHFAWHRVVFDDGEKRWLDLGKEAANNLLRWVGGAWPTAAAKVGRSRRAAGGQLAAIVTTELATIVTKPTPAAKPMPVAKAAPAAKPTLAAKLKREMSDGAPARRTKLPRARRDQAEENGGEDGGVDDVGEVGEMSEDEEDEDWAPEEGERKAETEWEDTDEDAEEKAAGPVQVSR